MASPFLDTDVAHEVIQADSSEGEGLDKVVDNPGLRAQVGRPSVSKLLDRHGPRVLVALLGAPLGRWQPELTANHPACRAARAALAHSLPVGPPEP